MPIGEGWLQRDPRYNAPTPGPSEPLSTAGKIGCALLVGGLAISPYAIAELGDRLTAREREDAARAAQQAESAIRSNVVQLRDFSFSTNALTAAERTQLRQIVEAAEKALNALDRRP